MLHEISCIIIWKLSYSFNIYTVLTGDCIDWYMLLIVICYQNYGRNIQPSLQFYHDFFTAFWCSKPMKLLSAIQNICSKELTTSQFISTEWVVKVRMFLLFCVFLNLNNQQIKQQIDWVLISDRFVVSCNVWGHTWANIEARGQLLADYSKPALLDLHQGLMIGIEYTSTGYRKVVFLVRIINTSVLHNVWFLCRTFILWSFMMCHL